ncbi:MAG: hypothetical protein L6Q38_15385, partial [Nitrospira sp.]|nr:hypothetical protein [Nitrospira sp.]
LLPINYPFFEVRNILSDDYSQRVSPVAEDGSTRSGSMRRCEGQRHDGAPGRRPVPSTELAVEADVRRR